MPVGIMHRGWETSETEGLLEWMKKNRDLIYKSDTTTQWLDKAKEEVFKNNRVIGTLQIQKKFYHFKGAWKKAKAIQDREKFGVKKEDCSSEENGLFDSFIIITIIIILGL